MTRGLSGRGDAVRRTRREENSWTAASRNRRLRHRGGNFHAPFTEAARRLDNQGKAAQTGIDGEDWTTDIDEAVDRFMELSHEAIPASKESGMAWLRAYRNLLKSMTRLQRQVATGSQAHWLGTLVNADADFVRDISQAYLPAARNRGDVISAARG